MDVRFQAIQEIRTVQHIFLDTQKIEDLFNKSSQETNIDKKKEIYERVYTELRDLVRKKQKTR